MPVPLPLPPPHTDPLPSAQPALLSAASLVAMSTRQIVEVSLHDWDNRKQEIAQQLFTAARDVGFFYISGPHPHPVPAGACGV